MEEAQKALLAAKVEASSAFRGVGLVKLMGRHSGFIAVKVQGQAWCTTNSKNVGEVLMLCFMFEA